jgi:hypothetical protein
MEEVENRGPAEVNTCDPDEEGCDKLVEDPQNDEDFKDHDDSVVFLQDT